GTDTHSSYCQSFFPNVNVLGFSGGGMNQVTNNLYNAFEPGDPRRNLTIDMGYYSGNSFIQQKFYKKWEDFQAEREGTTLLANNNFIVYRYAEVLLMLTEATRDSKYMDLVRERVGLPGWESADYPVNKYSTINIALDHEAR